MIDCLGVLSIRRTLRLRHFAFLLVFSALFGAVEAQGQICAIPGRDGAAGTITGIVNTYYPGTSSPVAGGKVITLGAATGASTPITGGDLLLVIQMQDATIDSSNNSRYGNGVNGGAGNGYTAANNTGRYEFVKATSNVSLAGGTLNLLGAGTGGGLLNAYTNADFTTTQGQRRYQVIRVPQYLSATLSSGLTALAWNGKTGGILAIDVFGTLTLGNATVSVAGLGFRGGAGLQLQGSGGSGTDYVNTAPTSATTLTGFHGSKGESFAGTPRYVWNSASAAVVDTGVEGYPAGSMARGAPANAGGGGTDADPTAANPGGNDENSGGGGGGNAGAGGVGGNSWSSNSAVGGFGGVVFTERSTSRIVMGGGGGAGSRNNNDNNVAASGAAAGGGIVIIRTGSISGTGSLDAGGAAAYNNTLNDGGGGGGAGGTVVVLAVTGNLTGLTVNSRGGRGGDAWHNQANGTNGINRHGPGGGGGGGYVLVSSSTATISVTAGTRGGTTTTLEAYGATDGANGQSVTNLAANQIPGVQASALCTIPPTAIEMAGYSANRLGKGKVLLEWETGYEVDNLGFNIYRQESGKERVRINRSMVAGSALFAGPGTKLTAGRSYIWKDKIPNGGDAVYWLEEIDMYGESLWHGPIVVGENPPEKSKFLLASNEVPDAKTIEDLNDESIDSGSTRPVEETAQLHLAETARPMRATKSGFDEGFKIEAVSGWTLGAESAVKLMVKREGWYRVAAAELQAAGLSPTADPRRLQMFVDGQEIAIKVIDDGRGKVTAVEFYGVGLDTQATDTHVYWLTAGNQNGKRVVIGTGQGAVVPGNSFQTTVERRDRSIYISGIRNGETENFFGTPVLSSPVNQVVNLTRVDGASSGQATIDVSIQGLSLLSHSIMVSLNGTYLGTVDFNAQENKTGKFTVPMSALMEGANTVTLQGQTTVLDVSLVDRIRINYWHTYAADTNQLKLSGIGGQKITVTGFTRADVRVLDVTSGSTVSEIQISAPSGNASADSVTFSVPGLGERTLFVFAGDQVRSVASSVANVKSNLKDTTTQADLVILTNKNLIGSFSPLKTLRESQGLKVAMVDVEDVFDEFSYGNRAPEGVKAFLNYARTNWRKAPRYVLIGGGGTFDPKNYVGQGANEQVSTKLIDTAQMESTSDDWFVDFDNDGKPEMAIGRLPANNLSEANVMVSKIVNYTVGAQVNSIALAADENDDFSFEGASGQLKELLPVGMTKLEIDRGQLGTTVAKQQLLDSIGSGQRIVNYTGHGSTTSWRSGFLTSDDARALTNGNRLPVFVLMTCLNGLFQDVNLDGLGPALMKNGNGGAVAVWASSALTAPGEQSLMNQELYRQLYPSVGSGLNLGDATVKAKESVANADVKKTWILLGDPTMKLN